MKKRLIASLTLLATLALAGLVFKVAASGGSDAQTVGVRAYAEAIKPLAIEGGRVVQQGMKPALVDLREGVITPAVFQERAQGWREQFTRIRKDFAAVVHPAHLQRIADTYDKALAAYIEAIDAFTAASRLADPAARGKALAAGADIAERADKSYDLARELLAKKLSRAGLDPQKYR